MKFHVYVPDSLFAEAEARRGTVTRSGFISNALRAYLGEQNDSVKETSVRGPIRQDQGPITINQLQEVLPE